MSDHGSFQKQLEALRETYEASLHAKIAEMHEAREALTTADDHTKLLEIIRLHAHQLRGSSGSFGYPKTGECAQGLELFVDKALTAGIPLHQSQQTQLGELLDALKKSTKMEPERSVTLQEEEPKRNQQGLVYAVAQSEALITELERLLRFFHFEVRIHAPHQVMEAVTYQRPVAVMVELALFENDRLPALTSLRELGVPLIVLSAEDHFQARLKAYRLGSDRFVTLPITPNCLMDHFDQLLGNQSHRPYRILIVDDDPVQAEFYSLTLERAGMITRILHNPFRTLKEVARFRADMLLLDLYMPSCDGREVAAVLRQHPEYDMLPIVFLSTEERLDRQLAAMRDGGEDFLSKPVEPEHLIALIQRRVTRARRLRSLTLEKDAMVSELAESRHAIDQHAAIIITDGEGVLTYANEAFLKAGDFRLMDLFGKNLMSRPRTYPPDMWRAAAEGEIWRGLLKPLSKTGRPIWLQATVMPVLNDQDQLQRIIIIATDISDATRRLQSTRHELQETEAELNSQRDFVSYVTHEMRTALNGIVGLSQLLIKEDNRQTNREYAEAVAQSAEHLVEIVNKTLDHAKIKSGKLKLERTPFDLRQVVATVVDLLAPSASADLSLVGFVDRRIPAEIMGDPMRLRQVLINLGGNALKFTQEGGVQIRVTLAARHTDLATLVFSVIDTGIGIPPERQKVIFQRFTQAENHTTRQFGGTGLGLSISAQLIQAMGGDIRVESEPGSGSQFSFSLQFPITAKIEEPLTTPQSLFVAGGTDLEREALGELLAYWGQELTVDVAQAAYVISIEPDTNQDEAEHTHIRIEAEERNRFCGLTMISKLAGQLAPSVFTPPKAVEASATSAHILVAEDNKVNQLVISKTLDHLGFSYEIVPDGRRAVEAVQDQEFDLVLMDCRMPEMDGFEATRKIRELSATLPVIAMTADTSNANRDMCLEAGMNDYLVKPAKLEQLRAMIDKHLKQGAPAMDYAAPINVQDLDREARQEALQNARLFAVSVDRSLTLLDTAMRDRDGFLIAKEAQSVGAAAVGVGAHGIAAICDRLYEAVDAKQFDVTRALFESLTAEYRRLTSYLTFQTEVEKEA